jgi:hypothetical protein
MRRFLALASVALLTGCGGGGEDFMVDVAMSPTKARSELAKLDGGIMLRALGLPLIAADKSASGALTFVVPGEDDSGTLRLQFEEAGHNATHIHVALDLPFQTFKLEGKDMMLDENRAEAVLQHDLEGWASGVGRRGHASLDDLNQTLGGLSIVIRPNKFNQLLAASKNPAAMRGLLDREFMAGMENDGYDDRESDHEAFGKPGSFGEPGDAARPMMDPDRDANDASRPMTTARGDNPNPSHY